MAQILEALDGWAGAWFAWAWGAALVSAATLALLVALRPLLSRALSSHALSWLWLLPLVPLVAPPMTWTRADGGDAEVRAQTVADHWLDRGADLVAPPAWLGPARSGEGASAAALEPAPATASATPAGPDDLEGARSAVAPTPAAEPGASAGAAPASTPWRGALLLAWSLIAASLLAIHVARHRRTRALLASAAECEDAALRRRVHRLARAAGVDARVRVLVSDRVASPAVAGITRPAVLLPAGLIGELDPPAFDWILRHELEHVRRRDLLVDACLAVLRAVWFVHPSVWLAPRAAHRARELACDEAALAGGRGAAGPSAAHALLHVLERGGTPLEARIPGAIPLTRTDSLERRRIMKLLSDSPSTRRLGALPAAGLGLASVLLLASGLRPGEAPPATDPVSRTVQETETGPADDAVAEDPALATLRGAMAYLVENQEQDGRWRAVAGEDGGSAGEFDDVGVTGVVLQALAACPTDLEVAGREAAMERGLAWLASQHDDQMSAFHLAEPRRFLLPSHAMATLGWIRAHGALGSLEEEDVREVTRHAVEMVCKARNPYSGWGFDYPPTGRVNSVLTGWMMLVLREADRLDVKYDADGVRDGLNLFDEWFHTDTGRVGWDKLGAPTPRLVGKKDSFPASEVEFPTAVATLAKLRWGVDIVDDPTLFKSAALLVSKAPVWSLGRGTVDSYYWAFGTMAVQPFGGVVSKRWNAALVEALVDHADRTPTGARFWAAVDAWHERGSEIAMTALCTLALSTALTE